MASPQARRARLNIAVPLEGHQRVRIAAAKRGLSIRDYVWQAVEARLARDSAGGELATDMRALKLHSDPVLAALWDNPRDAAYDKRQ